MKEMFHLTLILIAVLVLSFGNPAVAAVRNMENLPGLPIGSLRTELPEKTWRQLAHEPIKAYLVVRGQVVGGLIAGGRVIRSEGNGVYDKVAVQMADGMQLYHFGTGSRIPPTVIVHVIIYQLPKGEHAFALAQNDSVGEANLIYSRSIRIRFLGLANQKAPATKPKK
jgi:hypothetical protein